MSISAAAILAVLLEQSTYLGDKNDMPDERIALYTPVAEAIAITAKTPESTAALISIAMNESHLARYVLEGRCLEGPINERCDNGKARGAFQVHAWCKATDIAGEASCALSQFWWGYRHCHGSYEGAFAALSGHGRCNWSGSATRIRLMGSVQHDLVRAERRVLDETNPYPGDVARAD